MTDPAAISKDELQQLVGAIESDPVSALSKLTAHAKKKDARMMIDQLLTNREPVFFALKSDLPKARKNAARLIGALGRIGDASALSEALQTEAALFVVPSMLLALGSVGGSIAKSALDEYCVPAAQDKSEEKHVREIEVALGKARAALERDMPLPTRTKLSSPQDVLLVSPVGFQTFLQKELAALGFATAIQPAGVQVHTDDLKTLFTSHCASEVLLPIAKSLPLDPEKIAAAAGERLTRPYRVELRNYPGERADFIRRITSALGGGDNPSRYADELRIVCRNQSCEVYIRPCNVPDTRFAYRKRAIAASIHPATAACLARYALSFCTIDRPIVIDPFCGSGTLLFELEKVAPGATPLGVDISEQALSAARINAKAARSKARFIRKDILRFVPREPFDLILCNMPFGNRVGTHETNKFLYRGFVKLLPRLLSPGGVAVLYSMEYKLLKTCLQQEKHLAFVTSMQTEAGGLNPRVTVVRRKAD
jgi:23S rRNA G2445 N2-methylase RlmL